MKKEQLESKLDTFIKELKFDEKAKNTYSKYRRDCKLFIDSIKHQNDITKEDVINYKAEMIEKYKPASVKSKITIINKFLCYCDFGIITREKGKSNLEVNQIKLQHVTTIDNILEPKELKRMLRFAKKLGYMDMYLIMKIFAYTGIRENELKYFTVENVKKDTIIVVSKGKIRDIILPGDLKREIKKYIKENKIKSGYIFYGVRDSSKLISSKTIWWRLKKIAGSAKIKKEKIHAHSFRHLFSIAFIESGGTIEQLADILGHTSTETTRIYLRLDVKGLRKLLERVKY